MFFFARGDMGPGESRGPYRWPKKKRQLGFFLNILLYFFYRIRRLDPSPVFLKPLFLWSRCTFLSSTANRVGDIFFKNPFFKELHHWLDDRMDQIRLLGKMR